MRPTAVLEEEISSPLLLFVDGLALHMFSAGLVGRWVAMHRSCVICIHQLIVAIHQETTEGTPTFVEIRTPAATE